ncbi:methyltransferase CmcJ [Podospora conica]|nr:methyltransferase CmcJ [Schizothecium conicum]
MATIAIPISAPATTPLNRNETVRIGYTKWLAAYKTEKPYKILSDLRTADHPDYSQTNVETEQGEPETVHDIRGREGDFHLDSHGFQAARHEWAMRDWFDVAAVDHEYLPEVKRLLRDQIPGIKDIHLYNWRIRRNVSYQEAGMDKVDINDKANHLLPVSTAHIDSTPASARLRVRREMRDRAEELLKGRIRIVNDLGSVWRPINHRVDDQPLAVSDGSLVDKDDLLATDHVTRHHVGETYNVLYRDKYRWYYISHQEVDEVLLFKIYDSDTAVPARHCPHVSFRHSDVPKGTLPRESIEVRALIFSDN